MCRPLPTQAFQSTRPLRGATFKVMGREFDDLFQSTRPLRGATRMDEVYFVGVLISIHAPLAGRDRCGRRHTDRRGDFNPRAPCGARLVLVPVGGDVRLISIHAPLAGRDNAVSNGICHLTEFQSTRPLRGATQSVVLHTTPPSISIHAPLAGRDGRLHRRGCHSTLFQSTRPLRGATGHVRRVSCRYPYFNPRAPCGARLFTSDA